MNWTPVSQKLPERGESPKYSGDVAVVVETGTGPAFTVGYYCFMNETWYRATNDAQLDGVIAWRKAGNFALVVADEQPPSEDHSQ